MRNLIYLLLLIPLSGAAGLIKDPWFVVNPEAGAGISIYRKVAYETAMGPFAGLNLRFGKRFFIQAGVNVMQHKLGAKLDTSLIESGFQQVQAYYMNVPAVAGVHLVNSKLFKYRLYIGYVHSLFLGASLDNAKNVKPEDFQKSISSGRFGMGVDIWRLTLNANVDYGFTDVMTQPRKVGYLGFSAGLGFKLYPFK